MKNVSRLKKAENELAQAEKALEEERDQKIKSIREVQVVCMFSIHILDK